MHQVYIVCLMCASVLGNTDEAKYIDLLPEAEKQEFLNRIARRIIEEIHAKGTPEQSNVEVSDDQLNTHHTYVQDLINEESENMRNERRNYNENQNVDKKPASEESEKNNNLRLDNDKDHIDLTLRNDGQRENITRSLSDDSSFKIIPVKVIYDQDDTTTNNPGMSSELLPSNSEQRDKTTSPFPLKTTEENENSGNSDEKKTSDASNEYANESRNKVNSISTDTANLTENVVENTTEIQSSANTTLVTDISTDNKNHQTSHENVEVSTKIIDNSGVVGKSKESEENSPSQNEAKFSDNKPKPLPSATEISTQSDSKGHNPFNTISSAIYVTTEKSTKDTSNKKSDTENVVKILHSETEKTVAIEIKNKKNLRTGLNILSEENNSQEDSIQEYISPNRHRNKNIKPYLVYEVPEEKPIFIKKDVPSEKEHPYVIPIYNFAPKNAYYNAYNHFGINNDEETVRKGLKRKKDLDTEFYLQNGFKLDVNPKINSNWNEKRIKIDPQGSRWKHVLDSKIEYNPNFIVYQHNETLKRNNEHENYLRQKKRHEDVKEKLPDLSKIPHKIKYIPLRSRGKSDYQDETPNQRGSYKEIGYKLSRFNQEDRNKVVKQIISYLKEKFGRQSKADNLKLPNPIDEENYSDEYYSLDDERRKLNNLKQSNIDLDYYFGTYGRTDDDYDEYSDTDDVGRTESDKFSKVVSKKQKRDMKYDPDDDCEHGCIELNLRRPSEQYDKYLDNLTKVLKDMIYRDNTNLVNYNWLLSAVDLESALNKLMDLMDTIEKGNKIHPLDLELLNYIIYLYDTSSSELKNTIQSTSLKSVDDIVKSFLSLIRRRITLPKNNKRGHKLKNPIQYWYKYHIRKGSGERVKFTMHTKASRGFNMFLKELSYNMLELHTALKQIALITKYDNQNWYNDLKDIYLQSATNKQLLQVILHLAASNLFKSIEETAKNVEEDKLYINNNKEVVRRIQDEFIFVLKILERIKKID